MQSRAGQQPPLPGADAGYDAPQGTSWPFWLTGHSADSCPICHQKEPPDPFLQGAFLPLISQSIHTSIQTSKLTCMDTILPYYTKAVPRF